MKELYDELIGFLKRKEPESQSPEGLTDKIMHAIQKEDVRKLPYISLMANEKQWNLYRAVRVITTTAAAMLIIFLISEQWEMNRKLNRLQNELISSQLFEEHNKYPSRSEKIQQVLYEFTEDAATVGLETNSGEAIRINRKSLNYLLNKIQELEKENISYRTKLLQTNSDSIQFIQK
ncbi:MAG: hypothetical protein JXA72_03625 [Bacteroidales bacterium]|nr:hypothetical protein [Bacteroidales bacterium]